MPQYTFHNNETDETFDEFLTISGREKYLADNPHINQVPSAPMIVSGVDNANRLDGDYRDLIKQVKKNNYKSNIVVP